jgi:peptidoglycan hydrolase CwlO-like protein
LKKEVEESPLSVLRQELGARQLEITDMQSKVKSATEMAEDYKKKFEQVKRDMIQLKRQIDKDKEIMLTKQAEELE